MIATANALESPKDYIHLVPNLAGAKITVLLCGVGNALTIVYVIKY